MTAEKYIVALDLGTSGCRAFAVAADGSVRAQKSVSLSPRRFSKGCSEYEAPQLVASQLGALHQILDEIGPQQVAAISVASQRSTVVLWNKQTGESVAPVLTWEDGRAFQEADQAPITQAEIHQQTGLYKTPYFSAPKIAWCLKNIPAAQEAAQAGNLLVAPVASYFIYQMTKGKVFATDATLAQRTLLFDIHRKDWSLPLCEAFGVPMSCLPELRPSAADYGSYEYNGVQIPIRVCVGDQQAAEAFMPQQTGETSINYGTGAFVLHNVGSQKGAILPGLLTSLSATRENGKNDFLLEGPVNAASSSLAWLQAQGIAFESAELDTLCKQSNHPVWCLPALGGLGAPYWDYKISPVVAGLSPLTRPADWVAGAVRGIAFLVADIIYYLRDNGFFVASPRVSGGLSSSRYLLSFQADLLQTLLRQTSAKETTVLGAARLAAHHLGWKTEDWGKEESGAVAPELAEEDAEALLEKWRQFVAWSKQNPM